MDMTKADRVFREEMRKLRALRKQVKRESELGAAWRAFKARTGWKRGKVNPAVVERNHKAAQKRRRRKARERAETTLTSATVRDVMAMDRDFREAVSE